MFNDLIKKKELLLKILFDTNFLSLFLVLEETNNSRSNSLPIV